jgi:phage/plasmid-like protein (TIGR03299 family)
MRPIIGPRFTNRQLPWQSLSHPLPETGVYGAEQALHWAGLDYPVFKDPLYAGTGAAQTHLPDRFAVTRDTNPGKQILGIVGRDYTILQNMDLADALDRSGITDRFPVHSVGIMRGGALVFICLSVGSTEIMGDAYQSYLLIINGHDGSTAATISYTPVAIDCTNALFRGVKAATAVLSLTHGKHINQLLAEATQQTIPETAASLHDGARNSLRRMAHRTLNAGQVQRVLWDVFPTPPKPAPYKYIQGLDIEVQATAAGQRETSYQSAVERAAALRRQADILYTRFNDTRPFNRGTAYALYQALTELALHREGPSAKGKEDQVAVSVMVGSRAAEMGRAWKALEQIAA